MLIVWEITYSTAFVVTDLFMSSTLTEKIAKDRFVAAGLAMRLQSTENIVTLARISHCEVTAKLASRKFLQMVLPELQKLRTWEMTF